MRYFLPYVVSGLVVVLLASLYAGWSRKSSRSKTRLGFPEWEIADVAARLNEVEREFNAERLGQLTARLGAAQSRLAAIRPIEVAYGGIAGPLVRVVLLFEGSLEVSGIVDPREVARFMPLVRSGRVPRVSLVEMCEGGLDLVFVVEPFGDYPSLTLRLVDPRTAAPGCR